ncbi:MAG TPA: ribose 5-phosphate isomerase B [Candidatus Eremiobacteraceae bacterium]|nr:ribose 5-phosphate isomerase B [Candidatus Eremiobacteraceae bacterium]
MASTTFRIALGADHAGFAYKTLIAQHLRELGHEVIDFGTYSTEPIDYPLVGFKVGEAVANDECDRGVLVCGSSLGIAIAANKVKGVRAAPIAEPYSAKLSRQHNHCNVACFAERLTGWEMVRECLDVWLQTEPEGGRHARRVDEISDYESGKPFPKDAVDVRT